MIRTAADGVKEVRAPLSDADIESLNAGDRVRISGVVYTARDAAHARLIQLVEAGKLLDIPVADHIIIGKGSYLSLSEAGML